MDQFVLVLIDDILVYSKDVQEHEKHMRIVLETLRERGYMLNSTNVTFD